MSLNRYAKRKDMAQTAIVQALRRCGCDVLVTDATDLIVGRAGLTYILEVKNPGYTDRDLKPSQIKLRDHWRGQYAIVTTAEEALRAVGVIT